MNFITDTDSAQAKNILNQHKFTALKIQCANGHDLARFSPPQQGWTPYDLWHIRQYFPPQWQERTIFAYLGNEYIGGN